MAWGGAASAFAQEQPDAGVASVAADGDGGVSLESYRTPLEVLTERAIGTTSRPVRFDWRKSKVEVGATISQLDELNSFWSGRAGVLVRKPFGGLMGELALNRVQTWTTDNSRQLSETPYRQYGRPSRFELDVDLGFPLAEGVVTAWPRYFPSAELVFSFTAGFRYLFYPNAFSGAKFKDVAGAIFAPSLSSLEQQNLVSIAPPGMEVDPARYGLMAGFTTDIYLHSGFFVAPRMMIAVPLLAPITQTQLGFWWELSVSAGWSF
jgi:hypothetical protein